jgi:Mycothiol maleylpyruvate isomerase N-terminal domain
MCGGAMPDVRAAFFDEVSRADAVVRLPAVSARWSEASALDGMTVGDLTAHLTRAATTTSTYLDGESASGKPVSVSEYFVTLLDAPADLESPVNRGVRERSRTEASDGYAEVVVHWDKVLSRLEHQLAGVDLGRLIVAAGGLIVRVDDYLVTRILELCLHSDDLAVSVNTAAPEIPDEVAAIVAHALVDIARERYGNRPVLLALARRERAGTDVLRAF